VRIEDPYLLGIFYVLIPFWSEEIRESTTSDTFGGYELLVSAAAAALIE
jgi:hypothetical protein